MAFIDTYCLLHNCAVLTGSGIQSRCIHFTYRWRLASESSSEKVKPCRLLDTVQPPWLWMFSTLCLCQPESLQLMRKLPKLIVKHHLGKVTMSVIRQHTHTRTHRFNDPFSGKPELAYLYNVIPYQQPSHVIRSCSHLLLEVPSTNTVFGRPTYGMIYPFLSDTRHH